MLSFEEALIHFQFASNVPLTAFVSCSAVAQVHALVGAITQVDRPAFALAESPAAMHLVVTAATVAVVTSCFAGRDDLHKSVEIARTVNQESLHAPAIASSQTTAAIEMVADASVGSLVVSALIANLSETAVAVAKCIS